MFLLFKLVYLQSSYVAGFLIRSITGCKKRYPEKGQTYKPVRSAPVLDSGPLYHLSWLTLNQPLKSAQTWSDLWVPRNTARCRTKLTKFVALGQVFIYAYLKPNIVLSCFLVLWPYYWTLDRQKHVNPCPLQTAQSRYKVLEPLSDYRIILQLYETSLF